MVCNVGIYNLHMRAMGGGEKLTLALAEHLSRSHNVTLFCSDLLKINALEQFFDVDLSQVTVHPLNAGGPLHQVAARILGREPAVSLQHHRELSKLNLDVFINNSYASGLRCPVPRGLFMCMFPHSLSTSALDTYAMIAAISQYAADWVGQMWNRHAEVIYPPCDDMGPATSKRKIILNVGRFIAPGNDTRRHHKMQRRLLEAFETMTDIHNDGWELHFAGSVAPDNDSARFAASLKENLSSLPVFFHFDAPRDEIKDLYRTAAIYWHATGYGLDADKYPATQEHFGIATVEAMSAGAVPVVYSSGGQKEIVTDRVDGVWWNSLDALISHTRRLASDVVLRDELARQAVLSSRRFGKDAFALSVDKLMDQLLSKESATA